METIRFFRKAASVTEHAVGGHFGMNVRFAGHYEMTNGRPPCCGALE